MAGDVSVAVDLELGLLKEAKTSRCKRLNLARDLRYQTYRQDRQNHLHRRRELWIHGRLLMLQLSGA